MNRQPKSGIEMPHSKAAASAASNRYVVYHKRIPYGTAMRPPLPASLCFPRSAFTLSPDASAEPPQEPPLKQNVQRPTLNAEHSSGKTMGDLTEHWTFDVGR
jgi:hypothetical protein